jgi:hypothetical protein
MVRGFNMRGLFSGLLEEETPNTFTCVLSSNLFNERSSPRDYSPKIEISVSDPTATENDTAIPVVYNNTKTLTGFKFTTTNLFFEPPINVDEINITVY